ncbi:hypothetical protein LOK49_LG15G00696 [Camellia lanceoleosa]|uniref:Uncharacterized protein n=1 Tax=Camellia lanceoleosa TaxID=1840588 RepID=A0ACC0F4Q7_9ERIC|nr:hypothetical protein LOK49_LG15G00696 [Camellia lanceoleosa]
MTAAAVVELASSDLHEICISDRSEEAPPQPLLDSLFLSLSLNSLCCFWISQTFGLKNVNSVVRPLVWVFCAGLVNSKRDIAWGFFFLALVAAAAASEEKFFVFSPQVKGGSFSASCSSESSAQAPCFDYGLVTVAATGSLSL